MRVTLCIVGMFLALTAAQAQSEPYGGVKLLEGYSFKRSSTNDTINGTITKKGGVSIQFESGVSEGYAADPKNKERYLWYREQVVNGHKVMLALTKPGVTTKWLPEAPRSGPTAKILMVTFPGTFGPNDAANFYAEVMNEEEIADVLLMVLTFDPSR